MAVRYSTGLRTTLQGTLGLKGTGVLDAFFIDIRSGAQPVDSDQAPTGSTLLATYTVNGDGTTALAFGTPSAGVVPKDPTQTWSATGLAAGTAGWFRVRRSGDLGTTNTTDIRIDGSIATVGGDMQMPLTAIAVGSPLSLSVFSLNWKNSP